MLAPETVTDEESGTKFIAMNDVAVGANAVFTTDAAGYDLNGDGKLDDGDVMAILNHAAGLELLADASLADLNGDGTADEVDAQILNDILEGGSYEGKTLESLQSNDVVTVPANGSVQVKATLSLNEEGKQYMEENFSNGNYLEGYVYLNAETDAEGKSRAGAGPETGRRGQTLDLVALGHNDRTSAQKADAVDDLGP